MAFSSTNLIATSTLVQEPELLLNRAHMPSYADAMTTLNPRSQFPAMNVTPYNCANYLLSTTTSENQMVFKLASATYVQYVHATGDGYDGYDNMSESDTWEVEWESDGSEPTGSCTTLSNWFWKDA